MRKVACHECGEEFETKAHNAKWCSTACRGRGSRRTNLEEAKCSACGETFKRNRILLRHQKKRGDVVCGLECQRLLFSQRGVERRQNRDHQTETRSWRYLKEDVFNERGTACQLCGWDAEECDLAHIHDKANGGKMTGSNMLVLCPNDHRRYDRGKLLADEIGSLVSSMAFFGYDVSPDDLRKEVGANE